MQKKVDFLVIGTGIAGISFALKVAGKAKVCLICKTKIDETNTSYAQGGIASVTYEPDNFQKHINDTIICGDGLCDPEIVKMVVEDAPAEINQLIEWGTQFDKRPDGKFDLAREGGHSEHRILHHKDQSGAEIQRALIMEARKNPNIEIIEDCFSIDLITQHHLGITIRRYMSDIVCYGAYVIHLGTHEIETILAKVTILATGGVGNLYHTTVNPPTATGDGIAMVYRAKGIIENMEFVQFHPTSLYNPMERPSFLISEAVRGFGAVLRNRDGSELMKKYDSRGSLAPRDIVARAIDNEMKISGEDYVYLDATHLDPQGLKDHFPTILNKCLTLGIDITKEYIPVVPAAHFICGGIKVDSNGCTSINQLFAIGENSSTGLHGANRLASNSLLEGIVFADKAAKHALAHFKDYKFQEDIPDWNDEGMTFPEEMVLITQHQKEVQQIMSSYVGIVRSNLRLLRAFNRLEIIYQENEELFNKSKLSRKLCELRNLINVGYLVIKMARERRESRGLHYTLDFPFKR
jgi:L-aspartate oxidase